MEEALDFSVSGISCRIFLPKGKPQQPFAVFSHGFGASKEPIWEKHFVPKLLSRGIACLSFDYPGCGKSKGSLATCSYPKEVMALRNVISKATRRFPLETPPFLVGASRGGATSLLYSSKFRVRGLFLLAPRSDFRNALLAFPKEKVSKWRASGFLDLDSPKVRLPYSYLTRLSRTKSPLQVAERIRAPVLIAHGTADDKIQIGESRKLSERLPDGKVVPFKGADHFFRSPGARERAARICRRFFCGILMQTVKETEKGAP